MKSHFLEFFFKKQAAKMYGYGKRLGDRCSSTFAESFSSMT
jgi:hypothetical protein